MRAQISRELFKRIVEGLYRPGDRLIELAIAKEFETSQTPVREALRDLEALRVVETIPFRGTRVREVSSEELAEVALVRGILEEAAAVNAALVYQGRTDCLRGEADAMTKAAETRDFDAYAHHNGAFHRMIVQAGGNRVLVRIWESLFMEARTRLGLNTFKSDLIEVAATHFPIIDALHAGDGLAAGKLLREHAGIVLVHPSGPCCFPVANP